MKSNFLYLETTFKVYSWIHNFINGIKKWHFNPCELVKPTKKKTVHAFLSAVYY